MELSAKVQRLNLNNVKNASQFYDDRYEDVFHVQIF